MDRAAECETGVYFAIGRLHLAGMLCQPIGRVQLRRPSIGIQRTVEVVASRLADGIDGDTGRVQHMRLAPVTNI